MTLFMLSVGLFVASGLAAAALWRYNRTAGVIGVSGAVAAAAVGLVSAGMVLARGAAATSESAILRLPWAVPWGQLHLQIDALSAWFLVPVLLICGLAAIYGRGYLAAYSARKSMGVAWALYNVLAASMMVVLTARNGVLFLVAWEVMSLASFFLVTFEHERPEVRQAGWTYLVATHIGTAFLLVLFVLIGQGADPMDLASLRMASPGLRNLCFVLAMIGFGTKAGFLPLHVWLPEAHPAAPSHVSAVMSGVMIKMGIFGLVRVLMLLGPPPAWWGWTLLTVGAVSGIMGVLLALAQHDLKRLLAYHSVENIGIIAMGLGLGLLGVAYQQPVLAGLGFAGGLLHVVNHALFKGLLFLGAGSVLHATGQRDMDRLGGLLKRMPVTGVTFLIAAAAISGLPPLNGFVSEFLIYLGGFHAAAGTIGAAGAVVIVALALIGGLAAACFAKAFGVVFLGEPRTEHVAAAHEAGWSMRLPMLILAALCVAVGLSGPWVLRLAWPVVRVVAVAEGMPAAVEPAALAAPTAALGMVTWVAAGLLALIGLLALVRWALLRGRAVNQAGTWDCGYLRPTARMQYTSASFAQPLTDLFGPLLGTRRHAQLPTGLFPQAGSFEAHTPDVFRDGLFAPAFRGAAWVLGLLRWVQHGRVQLYVLYIVLTLLGLLIWKLS